MPGLTNKPPLTVVGSASTVPPPPCKLGKHGTALWNFVQREYGITDIGGIELLCLAAQSLDKERRQPFRAHCRGPGETFELAAE
jgi:hypothetical protein